MTSVLDSVMEKAENFFQEQIDCEQMLERTLFFIGSGKSGKSTLIIDAFGLNEEEVRPTLALDFFCAFHTSDEGYQKKICSIWELAKGTNYGPMLMTIKAPSNLTAVIMLDLSSPSTLWQTATTSLDIYRKYVETKYGSNVETKIVVPKTHEDFNSIKAFPIPLFIVGGKYDLFQDFEPEKKRAICQYLRFLAHINFGFLFFYSNKINYLSKTAKEIFNHHAFDTPTFYQEQFEYSKPLLISPGSDSFEKIEGTSNVNVATAIDNYNELLNTYFKSDETIIKKYPDNPRYDPNYKEPKIDYIRIQKDEALEKLIKEKELEQQMLDIVHWQS